MATEEITKTPSAYNTGGEPVPTIKINREVLWKIHESIQFQLKPINDFYEKNLKLIEDIGAKRDEVIKRYYQFQDGKLKQNAQQQYVLLPGVKITDFDKEMEALMSAIDEVQPSLLDLNIKRPQPEMKVVQSHVMRYNYDSDMEKYKPLVKDLVQFYYKDLKNLAGGNLHIVLDDGNLDSIQYCKEQCEDHDDSFGFFLSRVLEEFTEDELDVMYESDWWGMRPINDNN